MAAKRPPLIKDQPFIAQSDLTGRWYFVQSFRVLDGERVEAHIKHDVTDAVTRIITDHGGTP